MGKMNYKFTDIGPGLKSLDFEPFGGFEGFLAQTSNGGTSTRPQLLKRVLPWLAKATDMTALAVSELPFAIMKGDEVYDTSSAWKNRFGGMPTPQTLLYKLASSLCLGRAYVIPTVTSKLVVNLQYCAPQSVTPYIRSDIEWFDRATAGGGTARYYPVHDVDDATRAQMLYFWLPDSDVECGPAESYPAGTALLSAELLTSVDRTLSIYAQRGFVPATVLAAKGMGNPADRQAAESWWNRFLRGWTSTVAKIINAEMMTITKVGAGLDELRGVYGELNKQAIENIGTAYGVPAALFMSDMAFASEVNPMIKVWYTTSQFVKIYRCIENTFNTQLLNRWGLTMVFRPETIDAFQEDEVQRAGSFAQYVTSGIKRSVAAQMVGLELPTGVEYADLDPEPEAPVVPVAVQPVDAPAAVEEQEKPMGDAMAKWMRKAIKRLAASGSAASWFESPEISYAENERITAALIDCKTAADVRRVFENRPVDQIKRALDWLENHELIGAKN